MLCIIDAAAAVTTAATVTTVAFFQPRLGGFILAGPGLPGPAAQAPFLDLGWPGPATQTLLPLLLLLLIVSLQGLGAWFWQGLGGQVLHHRPPFWTWCGQVLRHRCILFCSTAAVMVPCTLIYGTYL